MSIDVYVLGLFFITIHLLANELIPAERIKRMRWLSFSGGLAVSYVFVYVLPSLHQEQQDLQRYANELTMESELYFIGLLGLLLFYGMEKAVASSEDTDKEDQSTAFFWLQIVFFTIYNMLISYTVIVSYVQGIQALFYGTAIGLHFIAVAHDLWRKDPDKYNSIGRYILASGIVLGWGLGNWLSLSAFTQSLIFAFISGAMILNVLKNELPRENKAHFPTFSLAVLSYTTLTLLLKYYFEW